MRRTINVVLWICFGLLVGFYLTILPKHHDDYAYLIPLQPWLEAHGVHTLSDTIPLWKTGIPWQEMWQSIKELIQVDNARLCNIAALFGLLFPHWLSGSLMWLCWLWGAVRSLRLAGIDPLNSGLLPVAIFFWSFGITWLFMGSVVFQFDYVITVGIVMAYISYLHRIAMCGHDFTCRRHVPTGEDGYSWVVILLFSIFVGWWQEAFSGPLLVGLISVMIIFKVCRTRENAVAAVGLAVGIALIFLLSHGHRERLMIYADMPAAAQLATNLRHALPALWPLLVASLLLVFTRCRKPLFIMLMGAAWVSFMLFLHGRHDRIFYFGEFLSAMLTVWQLGILLPSLKHRYTLKSAFITIPLGIIALAMWVCVDLRMPRMRDSINKYAAEAYAMSEPEAIFVDVDDVREMPMICGNLPYSQFTGLLHIPRYLGKDYMQMPDIPDDLEFVTEQSGAPLGDDGVRIAGGKIFAASDSLEYGTYGVAVDFGKGYTIAAARVRPFISKGDGRRYVYIMPMFDWYVARCKPIRAMRLPTTKYGID